jgi:hypothetical protein
MSLLCAIEIGNPDGWPVTGHHVGHDTGSPGVANHMDHHLCGGSLLIGLHLLAEYGLYGMIRFDTFTTAIIESVPVRVQRAGGQYAGGCVGALLFPAAGDRGRCARHGRRGARVRKNAAITQPGYNWSPSKA